MKSRLARREAAPVDGRALGLFSHGFQKINPAGWLEICLDNVLDDSVFMKVYVKNYETTRGKRLIKFEIGG
jgi:hypothetical protein